MPTYTLYDKETEIEEDVFMAYSDLQKYLKKNKNLSHSLATPAIVSGVAGIRKPDEGFRDHLRRMKKNNRGSTINVI